MSLEPLIALLRSECTIPAPPQALALYDSFCHRLQRPEGALAGLFYGSALWKIPEVDSVWDLYVLVDSYDTLDAPLALRLAGAVLPPNVYYHETTAANGTLLRGKIAVMTLSQFAAHCEGRCLSPQTWARLAQPCRLIATKDNGARENILNALAAAVATFHRNTAAWVNERCSIAEFWQMGLIQTYASEFRSERRQRQGELVAASAPALEARTTALLSHATIDGLGMEDGMVLSTLPRDAKMRARRLQQLRNVLSKAQHLLRLVKAAFTFSGGLDYLVYKIERHSGVRLEPSAFARRHPLIGVWPLFLRGLRLKAFR